MQDPSTTTPTSQDIVEAGRSVSTEPAPTEDVPQDEEQELVIDEGAEDTVEGTETNG